MRNGNPARGLCNGLLALGLGTVLAGCSVIGGHGTPAPAGRTASVPASSRPAGPSRTSPAPAGQQANPGTTASAGQAGAGNPPFYEVFGQRYYVLPDSDGYRAKGVASWYGEAFHGRRTSSGEIYDMHGMTAAHKTLPLPSVVRVTNLDSGQSVIVTVNDRGPFVKDRIIDLSYAAAKQLGMIEAGTCNVEVQALSTTPPGAGAMADTAAAVSRPASATGTVAATPLPARRMFMQVGAFGDEANAARLKARLESQGVGNVVIRHDDAGNPALYRVRIGPIEDARAYDTLASRVESLQIANPQLVTESPAPP